MSQDTGLYFAHFPKNFDKLRAVLVTVHEASDDVVGACHGPRQFYREIIFTEPDLLIAPESEENVVSDNAVIITEKDMLESGKLFDTLHKFSLEQKASIPLTRGLFLYCLQFVLTHRLAPLWNKIDKYFIQGRDFLGEENKMFAIQADFSLTDKITLAMKPQLVKLPKPKVEDFGVSPNIIQRFHHSDDFSIQGYSLENNKCLVLPSLKTGYITCISHRDSEGIDFKRYWKVMYGFRLPVSERDVYYSIRFSMSDKVFSYPEYCIRLREPQVTARCDQKAIFKSFLEDLTLRMPSICDLPLTFTSSTLYPTTSLHLASTSKQTNLTRAPVLSKANQPFVFTKKNGGIHSNSTPNRVSGNRSYQGSIVVSSTNMDRPRSPKVFSHGIPSQNIAQTTVNDPSKVRLTKPYVPSFTKHKSVKEPSKKLSKVCEIRKEKPLVPCFKKTVSMRKPNTNIVKPGCSNKGKCGHRSVLSLQGQHVSQDSTKQRIESNVLREANSQPLMEQNQPIEKQSSELQKKTAKAPKTDVIIDVRKMVAEHKLSKVSAAAITKWLKSEGVKCKCKEKKQELMSKVYQYLGLKQPEP